MHGPVQVAPAKRRCKACLGCLQLCCVYTCWRAAGMVITSYTSDCETEDQAVKRTDFRLTASMPRAACRTATRC